MKILADENIPADTVEFLKNTGHDTLWVKSWSQGANDEQIIAKAAKDSRILLTFDKDFGELVFKRKLPLPAGVIILRIPPTSPSSITDFVRALFEREIAWQNHFAVATKDEIRLRPLP